jgi:hypothetical protein
MLCDAVPMSITACGMTLSDHLPQIDISNGSQFALYNVFEGVVAVHET